MDHNFWCFRSFVSRRWGVSKTRFSGRIVVSHVLEFLQAAEEHRLNRLCESFPAEKGWRSTAGRKFWSTMFLFSSLACSKWSLWAARGLRSIRGLPSIDLFDRFQLPTIRVLETPRRHHKHDLRHWKIASTSILSRFPAGQGWILWGILGMVNPLTLENPNEHEQNTLRIQVPTWKFVPPLRPRPQLNMSKTNVTDSLAYVGSLSITRCAG